MRKLLISFSIIVLCSFNLMAQSSAKLTSVIIEGLKNVKAKAVLSEMKSKVKKGYSEETAKEDIKSLLALGYFENVEVSVDTGTWRMTVSVKEKPYITKVTFKGNKRYSSGKLKDEVTLKEKQFYDIGKVGESKEKVLKLYGEDGYADAKLEIYPTIDEARNQMTVSVLITEGNRILIGGVAIEGAKAYTEKKLIKLMKTRRKKVYKEETLKEDIGAIEKFYKNSGYTDAKVGEPKITYNEGRTSMNITVSLVEGPKYKFGEIGFSGNSVLRESELRKEMTIKSGKTYNEEGLQESRQAILEAYADRGYLHAQVEPQFNAQGEKGLMDVTFSITENNVVHVGNIYIDGLSYTKEYVIRREVTLKEGDILSSSKVRRSIEKIYNLGFMDSVEPELQPTDKPDVMDMALNVTEGKPGMLSAGAGYSSVDNLVGTLQLQHINLFGRGQRLNLTWEFGATKQNYEINWTEPWIFGKPMSLGLGLFNTTRLLDYSTTVSAYQEGRKGGSVQLGPRLNDKLSLLFSYSYEDISISNIDPLVADQIAESHAITSSVSSQIVWDTRDNIFDAHHGNRQSLSIQYAGGPFGGDINFIKPIVRSTWFFPTFWKFVLSLNASAGMVENFAPSTDVPIYERFYVGGADSVRGYQYRSDIGPAVGGKVMGYGNVEYKFPIVEEKKRTILQGAFFFDIGGAWLSANDVNLTLGDGDTNLKAGVGFGIRFTTPVFPLRLDYGIGLNHKPGEQTSQFYFTIGNIF